jgi:sensor histidine kinase regulating citrate/malate metabolism
MNSAVLAARLLGNDPALVAGLRSGAVRDLANRTTLLFDISDADIVRVYNRTGSVIFSPSDVRDNGLVANDLFVSQALRNRSVVQTFDVVPGVLAEQVAARAIYPVVSGGAVLGAVEIGYLFDNAYLDFTKAQTGLDVTMYAAARRSASTILTEDGVSRWVGTNETDDDVLQAVLGSGKKSAKMLDRLGVSYYTAFTPVMNADGVVIGMAAVGTPSNILLESLRQQLITTFLIAVLLSLVAAMVGYTAVQNFQKRG